MTRIAALVVLLLLPAVASANMFPGRGVPAVHVFTIEHEYPELEFWLASWTYSSQSADRLRITPSTPVRVPAEGLSKPYRQGHIYAVPKRLLVPFADRAPPSDWFDKQLGNGVVELGLINDSENVLFIDDRQRVERTHRIEIGPDGGRLVWVSENRGDPVTGWLRSVLGFLVMIVAGVLGLWVLRRLSRKSVATRT